MFKRIKQYIDLKIEELVSDKIQTVQDTLNKSIDNKFKKRQEPPKIDYDTITSLVRKANKNKDLKCEVMWDKGGPWIKINTTPFEEPPEIKNASYSLRPEDL